MHLKCTKSFHVNGMNVVGLPIRAGGSPKGQPTNGGRVATVGPNDRTNRCAKSVEYLVFHIGLPL